MKYLLPLLFSLLPALIFSQEIKDDFTLVVHEIGNPDGFNPLTSIAANALYIHENIFSRLLEFNRQTHELEPALALTRPNISVISEGVFKGGTQLEYEIRPEAEWDNGTPITGHDYLFTLKVLKFRQIKGTEQLRPYFELIGDVEVSEENPKKFIVYTKEPYFRVEVTTGYETFILPEYHYDKNKVMRKVSFQELDLETEITDNDLLKFAEDFASEFFKYDKRYVVGSGPYTLSAFMMGNNQYVKLDRKQNWWGDKVKDCQYLEAYPKSIIYRVMPDFREALEAFKDGKLDVIRSVSYKSFFDCKESNDFKKITDFHTTEQFAYHYIGLNTKTSILSDIRVRQALAHSIDRETMIDGVFEGHASLATTPMSPSKNFFNDKIPVIDFNLKKAALLLDKAGWKDRDKNGVREKALDGKRVELELRFLYNEGNYVRKAIAYSLKENLERIGVKLLIETTDFYSVLDKADARDFDLIALAWVKGPGLDDPIHVWHSNADREGGSNRVGFNSKKCDELIEELRRTIDSEKQEQLYKDIQELIVDYHAYVFLFRPQELFMIRKGFEYPKLSPQRPGYIDRLFRKKG